MVSKVNIFLWLSGLSIVALTVLFVNGCSPSIPLSPTPIFSRFLPPTWTPTVTMTPTATLRPIPSLTPTKALVSTLIPTITQTLPPSLTSLPTIPFDKFAWRSEVLLATNGGCRLPCFWGLTPGKTTVAKLKQFLAQFPEEFSGVVEDGQRNRYTLFYITFKTGDSSWSVSFWTDANKLTSILLPAETAQYSFPLAKLFRDYGMPEKIFIGPDKGFEHDLAMIVLYEKQQFAGKYILWQNELDKTLYCYDPQSMVQYVAAWTSDEDWSSLLDQEKSLLKPLTEVSDYDIPSLREKLKIPNRALCLHVQTDKLLP